MYIEDIIANMFKYWADYGCSVCPTYDSPMGAATFHPITVETVLAKDTGKIVYVQPSLRPGDGRGHLNSARSLKHHQLQVLIKPAPSEVIQLFLGSLQIFGIDRSSHDIRFVANNWQSPTLGATGIGYEVLCNSMEIMQFTYFTQMAGVPCNPPTVELAYGIERVAMQVQNCSSFSELSWSKDLSYSDYSLSRERDFSKYITEVASLEFLSQSMELYYNELERVLSRKLFYPAYELCLSINHIFNLMNARGFYSHTERAKELLRVRKGFGRACSILGH